LATSQRRSDRDWDRADAWLGLCSLALVLVLNAVASSTGTVSVPIALLILLALLAHPYLLLRVIRHFRDVPQWWGWALIGVAVAGTVLSIALSAPKPMSYRLATVAYVTLLQALAAVVLAHTAAMHRGLTAWRLNFAAAGAGFFVIVFILLVVSAMRGTHHPTQLRIERDLGFAMFVSYYLGLVPPPRVRRQLQRGVEYRFLRQTAERDPDERARLVPTDLAAAAVRSTAAAAAHVLIGSGPLRIDGTTDLQWRGLVLHALDGAVGRTLAAKTIVNGDVVELEDGLHCLVGTAERFLAVPITAGGRAWGMLLILQRRSSLFPKDDLAILERLCRYTAEIYDHSQLLADERVRHQREADARLDLILESLQDHAVITIDDAGLVTSWNAGAEHVFLYSESEAIGVSVNRLFDDGAPWLAAQLLQARNGEPTFADTIGRRRDETRLTTSLVIRPLQSRGRRSGGYVIVMRDISQRRLLEDRLRQAQKLEAIGRLAGGVAHDFNNMLTVILGYAENLETVVSPEQRVSLGEIMRAGERAASMTKQLLAFSRQQVLRPQVVSLGAVVSGVLPMLSRLLGEHIEIVKEIDQDAPEILADPTQLEQVVMNLAVNARDAMLTGGRLTIRVRRITLTAIEAAPLTGREGAHALLEVNDTGTGIDPATQARMFEPFFTTKEVGRGTGLGLAMVYGTVQQMNGAIAVESEPGGGTTFRIYVPAHSEVST
jgi:PAS domain S-box-containing protein